MLCFCLTTLCNDILTQSLDFRGDLSSEEIERTVCEKRNEFSWEFTDWIPDWVSMCKVPQQGLKSSVTMIGNHNSAQWELFKCVSDPIYSIISKKSICTLVMDEMEFNEAESNMHHDLISEYQPCHCCCVSEFVDEYD